MTTATTEPDSAASQSAASQSAASHSTASQSTASQSTAPQSTGSGSAGRDSGAASAETTVPAATPAPSRPAATHGTPKPIVGRRKEAIVRVRLLPGAGGFALNGRSLESYFPNKVHQQIVKEPLVTVDKVEMYDISANLRGGGVSGQAGALRLAIARALISLEPDDRPALKKAGFLTRDARETERKKYGLKKARKAPQYSKR